MNLVKAKILLDKINRLYTSMSLDEDNVAPIEVDLMKDYIKQLYESFLGEEVHEQSSIVQKPPRKASSIVPPVRKPVVKPPKIEKIATPPPPVRKKVVMPSPPPIVHTPTRSNPPPPPPPVVVENTSPPRVEQATPVIPPKPYHAINPEHSDLFHFDMEAKELSERLSLTRINDLSKAMGVNERIFTVNELFGADNSLYRDVIKALNNMNSFEEAKAFLSANVAEKFNWTHKTKRNKAKNFIKLVRRRYI